MGGDFDEMVGESSSMKESEGVVDLAGEGGIAGAEFDDRKGLPVVFPLGDNPFGEGLAENGGEFGNGGKIAAEAEDGAGAGVVSSRSVEGLGHEVVEAGEFGWAVGVSGFR